jgi:hypothetical protein
MPIHFYAVVVCKTPSCKTAGAVKYLGARTRKLNRSIVASQEFSYTCGTCHKPHRYKVSEIQIEPYGFEPPLDWQNQF